MSRRSPPSSSPLSCRRSTAPSVGSASATSASGPCSSSLASRPACRCWSTIPAELGADRIVNGVAAFARYGGPIIVVDFGTATTFDVITARGEYIGGVIAPGLGISADALFSRAAKLARVDIKRPARTIGTNTIAHLQSGLFYGYIGLVDGILERMLAEIEAGQPDGSATAPKVIATGGLAHMLHNDSKYITAIDDMLTLDGLRLLYERNRNPRSRGVSQPAPTI